MRRDGGGLQGFRECGHYLGRYRTCPSDTQETLLVRARPISQLRVTKANLELSTRLILRQRANLEYCRVDSAMKAPPDHVLSAPNAPVPAKVPSYTISCARQELARAADIVRMKSTRYMFHVRFHAYTRIVPSMVRAPWHTLLWGIAQFPGYCDS